MIHYIDELKAEDLKGKKVLLRLDLNVPIVEGQVMSTYRLEKIIETVDFLRIAEAQIVIVAHAENKEGGNESLVPVWQYLNGFFPVDFCATYFTPEAVDKLLKMENKGVLLFENVRNNSGEKENDLEFTKKLSQMADVYVNDAFGASHREHASIVGVPTLLPHYGGLLMREEIAHLSKVFSPEHPFIFILGGAKFETKLPLIKKYLDKADHVFVGGALANDIFKAKGLEVGISLVSSGTFETSILDNPKLITSVDVTVKNKAGDVSFKKPEEVQENECIVDAGPETITQLKNLCANAKTIVWNGPFGNYEAGFVDKTEQLAEFIANQTVDGITSILGGGDTLAVVAKLALTEKFSFVSTGGGAMLDYLVNETLPGIEVLK